MLVKKTYFLPILVLFLVFFVLIIILFPLANGNKINLYPSRELPSSSISEPSLPPLGDLAFLSFRPESLEISPGQEFTVYVFLETKKEAVSADLEILYDPKALIFQKISLSDFWPEGKILSQKIDQEKGKILLGISSFKPASGNGDIVSLVFKTQKNPRERMVNLMFGEKTQLFTSGGEIIPLDINRKIFYPLNK